MRPSADVKRGEIAAALEATPAVSDRELGRRLHVDGKTVGRVRAHLVTEGVIVPRHAEATLAPVRDDDVEAAWVTIAEQARQGSLRAALAVTRAAGRPRPERKAQSKGDSSQQYAGLDPDLARRLAERKAAGPQWRRNRERP